MTFLYRTAGLVTFLLVSVAYAWGQGQSVKGYAQSIQTNTTIYGNLVGQTDKAHDYVEPDYTPHYPNYSNCELNASYPAYDPGPDRAYKFTLTSPSTVLLLKPDGPGAKYWMLDTSGKSTSYNPACQDLMPGTYYVSVEQGSNTVNDTYSFAIGAVRSSCAPTIANRPVYWDERCCDNDAGHLEMTLNGITGQQLGELHVGGRNNTLNVFMMDGYLRIFADFNNDGDFDDASETIYTTTKRPKVYGTTEYSGMNPAFYLNTYTADNFSLSLGNPVFAAALGKAVRLRVMVSDTNNQGACGMYNLADYKDYVVKVTNPGAPQPPTQWVRQLAGINEESCSRTRTAPDGSVFTMGVIPWRNNPQVIYAHDGQACLTAEPGKQKQFTVYSYHHGEAAGGMVCRYNKNGALQWAHQIRVLGNDVSLYATLTLNGMATDKFGYVYICGSYSGSLSFISSDGANLGGVAGNLDFIQGSGYQRGFVAKFHPNGSLVYGFEIGNDAYNPNSGAAICTGLDVGPDLRLYVSGHFTGRVQVKGKTGTSQWITSRGNYDTFLAKFSDVGSMYWLVQGGGPGNDFSYGAAADKLGGGYMLGSFEGTATFNSNQAGQTPVTRTAVGGSDGFVLCVPIAGQISWVAQMGGSINDNVKDVCADPRGTGVVAVGGFGGTATFGSTTLSSGGYYDAFAVRLSNTGAFEWATKAGGFGQEQANAVRVGKQGEVYVGINYSGAITNPFGGAALPAPTDQDGAVFRLGATTGLADNTVTLLLGGSGNQSVLGVDTIAGGFVASGQIPNETAFPGFGTVRGDAYGDGWVARFSAPAVAGGTAQARLGNDAHTLRLYPNPSRNAVTLFMDGLEQGAYTLQVVSSAGRLVHQTNLTAGELHSGAHLEISLPPGLYMVQVAGKSCRLAVE